MKLEKNLRCIITNTLKGAHTATAMLAPEAAAMCTSILLSAPISNVFVASETCSLLNYAHGESQHQMSSSAHMALLGKTDALTSTRQQRALDPPIAATKSQEVPSAYRSD